MRTPVMFTAALAWAALTTATAGMAQTGAAAGTGKAGAMTIRQASGGGVRHGPRTGRQPTRIAPHVSQGARNVPRNLDHATTSRGTSGLVKGPTGKPGGGGKTRTGAATIR